MDVYIDMYVCIVYMCIYVLVRMKIVRLWSSWFFFEWVKNFFTLKFCQHPGILTANMPPSSTPAAKHGRESTHHFCFRV